MTVPSIKWQPFDRWRYLVSFARYIELLVENWEIFILHLYLSPHMGWPRRNLWRCSMLIKLEWLGYHTVKKNYDNMLSRFHLIAKRHGQTDRRTDGRTDGETDRTDISISRVSVPTRNNYNHILSKHRKSLIFYIQHNSKQLTGTYYGT